MSFSEKTDISTIINNNASNGSMSCAQAFKIANEYSIFPDILGMAIDSNKIKLKECQLGLFGHGSSKIVRPAETVSETLEDKIFELLEDEKLPCAAAWSIASELKISKLDVACACEKLKIKIFKCQLGAF
ncbi:MAG TPA: hypothetical protein P5120_00185 [Spirochaetota bacterium]|nr:hypothetical protein [Spirochaetota bacterium]HPF05889.1 hypothetical protein [Spirochaetota bacterium]HPJ40728.1 hypothetical protein [Spirochaetota bacterium]HPR35997.1 hypothetical protein [Spirochaetota bacterium]HRX45911.1 hypothetical protein [Spirochaetota bacterium]